MKKLICKCDACGRSVDSTELYPFYIDGFERKGSMAVGCAWKGDLCGECLNRVRFEESKAEWTEIRRIQRENDMMH